jgi:hypothetical protein
LRGFEILPYYQSLKSYFYKVYISRIMGGDTRSFCGLPFMLYESLLGMLVSPYGC